MIPRRIAKATHNLGAPKGWDANRDGNCGHLWVRAEAITGTGTTRCLSAWEPTPEELAMLNAGGSVVLSVVGGQPPVWLSVEPQQDLADSPPPRVSSPAMKITDLEPRWLRYEQRLDTWTVVDRQPGPGETAASVPHHEVTGMRAYWPIVDTLAEAQGIEFLCPKCFAENKGPVGTHAVICWSRSRGVPDAASPGPGRWLLVGSSFDDLTLDGEPGQPRSVLLQGGCAWHGFVTSGVVTNA